jgi:hypothetical protein
MIIVEALNCKLLPSYSEKEIVLKYFQDNGQVVQPSQGMSVMQERRNKFIL